MRVVIDTNVFISSLLSAKGAPAQLMALFEAGAFELVVTRPLLAEYEAALGYEKVRKLHGMTDAAIQQSVADLQAAAILVSPMVAVQVTSDPDDDMLFAAALAGKAEWIISGDAAVQAVNEYQGIRVLSPALFLRFLSM